MSNLEKRIVLYNELIGFLIFIILACGAIISFVDNMIIFNVAIAIGIISSILVIIIFIIKELLVKKIKSNN